MIRDPVIVLGAPRSGTSMLFEVLARSGHLWSLGDESHEVLEGPFHPRLRGFDSNVLEASDLDDATSTALRREFTRRAQPGFLRRAKQDRHAHGRGGTLSAARLRYALVRLVAGAARLHSGRSVRLLEKTPKNCLRIPFLRALFPDARFVFLRRDGRPTVSSLMDAWRAGGRYVTYHLPEPVRIAGRESDEWCFLLPPGWRRLAGAPLEEVCAAQWLAAVDAVRAALPGLRAEGCVYELAYEELVDDPLRALEPLCAFLDIPWQPRLLLPAGRLPSVNVLSAPEAEKWRRRNGPAVVRVLPRLAAAQRALGYPTGDEPAQATLAAAPTAPQ